MKKLCTVFFIASLVLSMTSIVMAGGITNKQNFSVEYLRTFSRNAAIDSADAVAFNPAGVMQMENGFYVNLGLFYALKDYSNTIGGTEYESDEPSMVPGLFGLYKKDRWAVFGAFTVPGGGGEVQYSRGDATTFGYGSLLTSSPLLNPPYDIFQNQYLEGESVYYGYTIGGAYALNDMVSVSLGARYIDASEKAKASLVLASSTVPAPNLPVGLEYEETADGWGAIVGLSIAPEGPFNIGMRYETKTKLDFETSVIRDTVPGGAVTNGSMEREDLPGLLGFGAGYRISPDLKLDLSFTWYLEKNADRSAARFQNVSNGYDLALAVEYDFNPKLKGSAGYMYTNTGLDPDNMLPEAPELNAQTICTGLAYKIKSGLYLNGALMGTFYEDEVRSDGIVLEKRVIGFGLGIQYKFM